MRVYLSGPMAGMPDSNRLVFIEARERLLKSDHSVWDPTAGYVPETTAEGLRKRFRGHVGYVVESDAIVLLPGFARSETTKVELALALALGLPAYLYHKHRPDPLELLANAKVITRVEALNG
jgi:Domain of unknown function (DUF4406)